MDGEGGRSAERVGGESPGGGKTGEAQRRGNVDATGQRRREWRGEGDSGRRFTVTGAKLFFPVLPDISSPLSSSRELLIFPLPCCILCVGGQFPVQKLAPSSSSQSLAHDISWSLRDTERPRRGKKSHPRCVLSGEKNISPPSRNFPG